MHCSQIALLCCLLLCVSLRWPYNRSGLHDTAVCVHLYSSCGLVCLCAHVSSFFLLKEKLVSQLLTSVNRIFFGFSE